ncbi:SRPBCC family protein [Pseudonocardia sp. TRM90224]|uniref:SRPBCC family protein n=1 Tax=Pseudonocardia sp. TRM90224 TaxID=2812678 RepID=UPI001E606FBA|nr:SRPBCC domain-containing protein [Pseudonocardia sp. TRM90224]
MSETSAVVQHSITVARTLPASPETLYAAWTVPDRMRQWFATVVEADVRVGGRYRIENHEDDGNVYGFTGEYLTLEPHETVAFTFVSALQTPDHRISDEKVTVTIREVEPGRTEVSITNTWTGPEETESGYTALRAGWDEWIARLEKIV